MVAFAFAAAWFSGWAAPAGAQMEERKKDVEIVKAFDARALIGAVVQAAKANDAIDKPVFRLSSFSADSGVVRIYEEHLRVDTLDKGSSYSYYSSGCFGPIGSCTYNTVFKPAIVDDRGMVTTWRRVSFEPTKPGEFSIMYERWEPDGDGVTSASKKERRSFFAEVRYALKGQKRGVVGGADRKALAEASERAGKGAGPTGTYTLVSVNDRPLPFPIPTMGIISGGTFVIESTGAYRSIVQTSVGGIEVKGKYTLNGSSLMMMTPNRGLMAGTVGNDTLRYLAMGQRYVFVKEK